MAVKLHRCSTMWVKISAHPCWKVQKALDDDAGVEYEVVKHPVARSKRDDYIALTAMSDRQSRCSVFFTNFYVQAQ